MESYRAPPSTPKDIKTYIEEEAKRQVTLMRAYPSQSSSDDNVNHSPYQKASGMNSAQSQWPRYGLRVRLPASDRTEHGLTSSPFSTTTSESPYMVSPSQLHEIVAQHMIEVLRNPRPAGPDSPTFSRNDDEIDLRPEPSFSQGDLVRLRRLDNSSDTDTDAADEDDKSLDDQQQVLSTVVYKVTDAYYWHDDDSEGEDDEDYYEDSDDETDGDDDDDSEEDEDEEEDDEQEDDDGDEEQEEDTGDDNDEPAGQEDEADEADAKVQEHQEHDKTIPSRSTWYYRLQLPASHPEASFNDCIWVAEERLVLDVDAMDCDEAEAESESADDDDNFVNFNVTDSNAVTADADSEADAMEGVIMHGNETEPPTPVAQRGRVRSWFQVWR